MVIIILPAFNEAEGIGELIEQVGTSLSAIEYHIVVVNDGSDDDTGKIVTKVRNITKFPDCENANFLFTNH